MMLSRMLYSRKANNVDGDVLLRLGFCRLEACELEKMGSSEEGAGRLSGVMMLTDAGAGIGVVTETLGSRSELRRKTTFRRTDIEGSESDLSSKNIA